MYITGVEPTQGDVMECLCKTHAYPYERNQVGLYSCYHVPVCIEIEMWGD